MEQTIIPGDYIFVNKWKYGARLPLTPFALPFAHSEIPLLGKQSYSEKWQLPYTRVPGFSSVERNDVVLFNYPLGDEPIDRRQNFIKRCVALAGDTLEIVNGQVLVNGELLEQPAGVQFDYNIITKGKRLDRDWMHEWKVSEGGPRRDLPNHFKYALPTVVVDSLRKQEYIHQINRANIDKGVIHSFENTFPKRPDDYPWNRDNFGPIIIPKEGDSLIINKKNSVLYEQIVDKYDRALEDSLSFEDKIKEVYVVQQDYYFLMGDNRHQSSDSRFWGFVPEDHIVGKASSILFSIKPGYKWYHKSAFETDRFLKGL